MSHSREESVDDLVFDVDGLPELQAAIPQRLRRSFEQCVRAAMMGGAGDESVVAQIKGLHLSEKDRSLLTLAYSMWRGVGPVVNIQQLWGMEPELAARVLASIAVAAGGDEASTLLEDAAAVVEEVQAFGRPNLEIVKDKGGEIEG
jgi:hypothetical protein